jgi:ribonucleoside-diphosphate reductase alpha chain
MTVEGAPHLKPQHLPVFDCANKCGRYGKRFIAPMAHVRMMAAAQPFLSGAISKTINMPGDATVAEVGEVYMPPGSTASRPTPSTATAASSASRSAPPWSSRPRTAGADPAHQPAPGDREDHRAHRPPLPRQAPPHARPPRRLHPEGHDRRPQGLHPHRRVRGRHLGEIFIDMHKEGAAFRSLMNCFAIAISLGLQYGVPLEEFVDAFVFTRFEPNGMVQGHPRIKMSTSIIDYIFRELAVTYLGRNELAHVNPEDLEPDSIGGDRRGHQPRRVLRGGGRLRARRHPGPAQAQRRRPRAAQVYAARSRAASRSRSRTAPPRPTPQAGAAAKPRTTVHPSPPHPLGQRAGPRRPHARLRGRRLHQLRQLHHGPQRLVPEVRQLRRDLAAAPEPTPLAAPGRVHRRAPAVYTRRR